MVDYPYSHTPIVITIKSSRKTIMIVRMKNMVRIMTRRNMMMKRRMNEVFHLQKRG